MTDRLGLRLLVRASRRLMERTCE